MTKLTPRYSEYEMSRLTECMKPVEKWSKWDHQQWVRVQFGFRHFAAQNVIPIEHFRPSEPLDPGELVGAKPRSAPRSASRSPPPRSTPPRKPAA
jgi:hypothetical protein